MDYENRPSIDSDTGPDAPLLSANSSADGSEHQQQRLKQALNLKPKRWWHVARTPRAISAVVCVAIFLWVLSGMVVMVPAIRLAEDIFCRRRYHHGNSNQDGQSNPILLPRKIDCKSEQIQSSMAYLFGLSMALGGIVGLVAVLPYGVLADRARKPVYLLAATGQGLNVAWSLLVLRFWKVLPVELVLLGPVFELVGGGLSMAIVVLYAVISDVNEPENRAITYFFASLAANAAVFVGPPLASGLMETWSPWVPMVLSLVITATAGGLILLMPETARPSAISPHSTTSPVSLKDDDSWLRGIKSQLSSVFYNSEFRSVLKKRSVILLLIAFTLAAPLPTAMGPLFLQYYSKRFEKSIEDAGYMLAIRGGLTVVILGVVLPTLSKYMGSSKSCAKISSFRRDLLLAQASAACASLGYLLLGGPNTTFLVSGIVVLAFSTGLPPLCHSLISGLVAPDQMSQIFTVVSIVEGIGSLPAGPFLAWTFSSGMRLGGPWFGLPFFVLGGLGLLCLVVLCLILMDKRVGRAYSAVEASRSEDLDIESHSLNGEVGPL